MLSSMRIPISRRIQHDRKRGDGLVAEVVEKDRELVIGRGGGDGVVRERNLGRN